jgi:hypothetical protein
MPANRVCKIVDLPTEPLGRLSDYRTGATWLRNLVDSQMEDGLQEGPCAVGPVRSVGDPEQPRAREKFMACDELRLTVSYMQLNSLPMPARNYVGTAHLIPLSDGQRTVVEWSGTFDADEADVAEVRRWFEDRYDNTGRPPDARPRLG